MSGIMVHVAKPDIGQLFVKARWKTSPFKALITLSPCPWVSVTVTQLLSLIAHPAFQLLNQVTFSNTTLT